MIVKVFNQHDMAQAFYEFGMPKEIEGTSEGYIPYGTETEDELFDEAMDVLVCSVREDSKAGVKLIY